jgi:hypothetical protein
MDAAGHCMACVRRGEVAIDGAWHCRLRSKEVLQLCLTVIGALDALSVVVDRWQLVCSKVWLQGTHLHNTTDTSRQAAQRKRAAGRQQHSRQAQQPARQGTEGSRGSMQCCDIVT